MLPRIALFLIAPILLAQAPHPDTTHLQKGMTVLFDLVGQYDKACEAKVPFPQIPTVLNSYLAEKYAAVLNPSDPAKKAFRSHMVVLEGHTNRQAICDALKPLATLPGQTVFGIQVPTAQHHGFLVAVYRPSTPMDGNEVVFKSVAIE